MADSGPSAAAPSRLQQGLQLARALRVVALVPDSAAAHELFVYARGAAGAPSVQPPPCSDQNYARGYYEDDVPIWRQLSLEDYPEVW
jgi:hypothetical protein